MGAMVQCSRGVRFGDSGVLCRDIPARIVAVDIN